MKTNSASLVIAIFSIIFFCSCHKHDTPAIKYRVAKSYIYDDQGNVFDSAIYNYTNNLVSRVDVKGNENYYYTFEYISNHITKKNIFSVSTATTPDSYETISYNIDGTINQIKHFSSNNGSIAEEYDLNFIYSNGKLSKTTQIQTSDGSVANEFDYTYTNTNITGVSGFDNITGQKVTGTAAFTFDSKANYIKNQFSQSLLIDLIFDQFFDEGTMPILLSANNMVGYVDNINKASATISYTFDSNGNLTQFNNNGIPVSTYVFQTY